jgi:ketosteroid isomerase-like protein
MDIKAFLLDWLEISNSYNTENYLAKYLEDAVLDDPSVGRKFVGHKGIKEYYTSYFIGYKTQTKLIKLDIQDTGAHLEVEFTGEFPEGKIGGIFDFTFQNQKIATVLANLK